jgi:hypothetical protein
MPKKAPPVRAAARLLDEGPGRSLGLVLCHVFVLQNSTYLGWACLDSNQGPLPFQRGNPITALCRPVRITLLDEQFFSLTAPNAGPSSAGKYRPGWCHTTGLTAVAAGAGNALGWNDTCGCRPICP